MSDKYLVDCCSGTLAAIKCASLFSCTPECDADLNDWIAEKNAELNTRGIHLYVLKRCESCALVYVFRISQLRRTLEDPKNRDFLLRYGYPVGTGDLYLCLSHLKERMRGCSSSTFPHEIGVFLGYPLCDVTGFIDNRGKNYTVSGLWKSYTGKEEAGRTFSRLNKCHHIYWQLWVSGRRSILQLTVAG